MPKARSFAASLAGDSSDESQKGSMKSVSTKKSAGGASQARKTTPKKPATPTQPVAEPKCVCFLCRSPDGVIDRIYRSRLLHPNCSNAVRSQNHIMTPQEKLADIVELENNPDGWRKKTVPFIKGSADKSYRHAAIAHQKKMSYDEDYKDKLNVERDLKLTKPQYVKHRRGEDSEPESDGVYEEEFEDKWVEQGEGRTRSNRRCVTAPGIDEDQSLKGHTWRHGCIRIGLCTYNCLNKQVLTGRLAYVAMSSTIIWN